MAEVIGRQKMSGVQIPQAASQRGSNATSTAVASGLADLINTGAALYGNFQERQQEQQELQAAREQAQTLAEFESGLIDIQQESFKQADALDFESSVGINADVNNNGILEPNEAKALSDFNKKKSRIASSSLSGRRRQQAILRLTESTLANNPELYDTIIKRQDKALARENPLETALGSKEAVEEFQTIYGANAGVEELQRYRAMKSYAEQQGLGSVGEVPMNHLANIGDRQYQTQKAMLTQSFLAKWNENSAQFRKVKDIEAFLDNGEMQINNTIQGMMQQAKELQSRGYTVDMTRVQEKASEYRTDYQEFRNRIIKNKDPEKIMRRVSEANDLAIKLGLQEVFPALGTSMGDDAVGSLVTDVMTAYGRGGEEQFNKAVGVLTNVYGASVKDQAVAAVNFLADVHKKGLREQLLEDNPYGSVRAAYATLDKGGAQETEETSSSASTIVDGLQSIYSDAGGSSQRYIGELSRLTDKKRAEKFRGNAKSSDYQRLESLITADVRESIANSRFKSGAIEARYDSDGTVALYRPTDNSTPAGVPLDILLDDLTSKMNIYMNISKNLPEIKDVKTLIDEAVNAGQ